MEDSSYKNKNIEKNYSNTWYDWLFNNISRPITKIVGGFKDRIVSIFNTNTSKQTMYGRGKKLSQPKREEQSEENKINSRNPFILKKEKNIERIIKDIIIRAIWTIF